MSDQGGSGRFTPRTPWERRPVDLGGVSGNWASRWGRNFRVTNGALCDLYTKLDRVLGGKRHRDLVVTVAEKQANFPSATDGQTVWLNEDALADAATKKGTHMMSLFGLNYHELAHVLHTPKLDANTRQWMQKSPGRADAFNILEDMRIERLIRQRYPKMTIYFLATCYKYYFNIPLQDFKRNWYSYAMLAERRYVPREDRQHARDVMTTTIGERDTARVEAIEAEYIRFVDLQHKAFLPKRVQELIDELASILNHGQDVTAVRVKLKCNDDSHRSMERDDKKKKSPGQAVKLTFEEIEGDDEGELEKGGNSKGKSGKSKEDEALARMRKKGFTRAGKATVEFLDEAVEGSVEIQRDMQLADQVVARAEFNLEGASAKLHRVEPVNDSMRRQRDTFVRELLRLQEAVDPGWDPYQASGRLNIGRAMRGEDPQTVFDDWREDRSDALDIECKMLMDMSGSMAGVEINEVSKAFWVVASGLNKIDATIDQIGYSDDCFQLRPRGEDESPNTYRRYGTIGGTNPRVGIAKSLYDFQNSQKRHKVFIILTDGGWYQPKDDEDIKAMRALGVSTVMVFVGTLDLKRLSQSDREQYTHGCEHFITIKRGEELADFASKLVTAMISDTVSKLRR